MAVAQQAKEKTKGAIQGGAKKLLKKYGWGYILEWTPFIGWLVPGDIMLVWRTLEGNLTSPEGVLMIIIATLTYVIKIIIGIIEIWFDLGIFTTLITWTIAGFFAFWIYIRGSGSSGNIEAKEDQTQENAADTSKMPQKEEQKPVSKPAAPTSQKKAA